MNSYFCAVCSVNWWPAHYKEFDACPTCGGGVVSRQEPGSIGAEGLFAEALRARRGSDERKANLLAFDEYYAAHCHEQTSAFEAEVRAELDALPITKPRRDEAA